MQFQVWTKGLETLAVECLVLGIFEDGEMTLEALNLDASGGGRLQKLLARGDFPGALGDTLLLIELAGMEASRVLLTGLGPKKSFCRKAWRKACSAAVSA